MNPDLNRNLFFNTPNEKNQDSGDAQNNNIWNQKSNNNQDNKYQQGQGGPNQGKRPNNFALLIIVVVSIVFFLSFFMNNIQNMNKVEIPYSQFLQHVTNGEILSITVIAEEEIEGVLRSGGTKFVSRIPYYDSGLVELLKQNAITFSGTSRPITFLQIISSALPWLVSIVFILYMLRSLRGFGGGGGGLPFAKNRIRAYVQNEKTKVSFSDVAGQDEAKYELEEVVEFLKQPEKFQALGAKIPRGVLLVGSPGTGKTLLARACAGEAEVKFFYMSGSDFVEMFAGVGASRVRELFDQARKNSPCIVFIDELDAVARARSSGYGGGTHDEREQTLNQLLVEMDGFEMRDRIIVLAATNRPDVLDHALMRPGRFDRQVVVDMPDISEREQILAIHAKNVKLSKAIDLNKVAKATVGCSGADLANLINEAALYAARSSKKAIEMEDLEEARDKILMGAARKSKVITPEEKMKTARHEAGHALLHLLLENADPLHKVTIIPRGRALGVAFSLPEQDSYGKGKAYLLDRISICYGGYVAENMYYSETSTGVQNDLEQATKLATRMVRDWGMSKLGAISFSEKQSSIFLPIDAPSGNVFSEDTNKEIDKEISAILQQGFQNAKNLLESHEEELNLVSEELMKQETLIGDQVKEIYQNYINANPNNKRATSTTKKPTKSTDKKAVVGKSTTAHATKAKASVKKSVAAKTKKS